jgi:hypothetical protein
MIQEICRLDERQREKLLSRGRLELPLRELDPALQHHLGHWTKGKWGQPDYMSPALDPDGLPRFSDPEDRWAHSVVALWWHQTALQLELHMPDVGRFSADVIPLANDTPVGARHRLIALGYREGTSEAKEAIAREAREWQESHEAQQSQARDGLRLAGLSPVPHLDNPWLSTKLRLDLAPGSALSEVLESIARQCGLAVVSNHLPREHYTIRWLDASSHGTTLGTVLLDIRRDLSGAWSWEFHGRYLVTQYAGSMLIEAARLPEGLLCEYREKLGPGRTLTVDALASLVAGLNQLQLHALKRSLGNLDDLRLGPLRVYGMLDDQQRNKLAEDSGLSFHELGHAQQYMVLKTAREARPWIALPDLRDAVLRTLPRTLVTGEGGISLVIEYRLSDAPRDRDVVFTSPLVVLFPNN